MDKKKMHYSEYPLKRRLIQVGVLFIIASLLAGMSRGYFFDALTAGRAPNSKHDKEELAYKDETVYIDTDEYGKATSTLCDVYITNNKEVRVLKDKSNLRHVSNNEQRYNDPVVDEVKGELTWTVKGKDVSYEGYGKTNNLPVEVKPSYYLDGEKISPSKLKGCSGELKIVLRYISNDKTEINGQETTIPYFALSMLTFGTDLSDVKVSNGEILKTGGTSIVITNAMAGVSDVLGGDSINGVTDVVTINGTANNFDPGQMVTVLNGDILKLIDQDTISKMNLDDKVDKVDALTRKIMAVSKKGVAALQLINRDVMPKAKATTKAVSKTADKLAEESPAFLKKTKAVTSKVAIIADTTIYILHKIFEILHEDDPTNQAVVSEAELAELVEMTPEERAAAEEGMTPEEKAEVEEAIEFEESKKLIDAQLQEDAVSAADLVNKYLNGYTKGEEKHKGLSENWKENINATEEILKTMPETDDNRKALQKKIDEQKSMLSELEGVNTQASKAVKEYNDKVEELAKAQKKLDEINKIFEEDWWNTEFDEGKLTEYFGEEEAAKILTYMNEIKKANDEATMISDEIAKLPIIGGYFYTLIDNLLSQQNQDKINNTTQKIAKAMRVVDKVTIKLSGIINKAAKKSNSIYAKTQQMYKKYVLGIINLYNSNIRGVTDKVSKLKKAQDKAGVYSGLSEDMEGTSTYMIFTPIGGSSVDLTEEEKAEKKQELEAKTDKTKTDDTKDTTKEEEK